MTFTSKTGQLLTLLFLSLIWGSSFILMKRGLESYSSMQVAAMRIFFSFLFLLPWTIKNLKVLSKDNIQSIIIVGMVGFAIPAILFTTAQTRISSSLAGMLNSLTPLFTLIIGVIMYRAKAKRISIVGILVGLLGATGLILERGENLFSGINAYALLVVAATLCYGINVNEVKHKLEDLTSMQITSLAFFFTGPIAGIYLLFSDFSAAAETAHYLKNLGYIAILALFSSVIAVLIFNKLIKFTTALFASSVTYIIPVFAILWGIFDGEPFSFLQLIWISVILLGVYLVNK